MSKLKDKKNKKAAEQDDKNVRKITEFIKPKPEQPSIPKNDDENSVPDAAIAGSLACRLGYEKDFSAVGQLEPVAEHAHRPGDFKAFPNPKNKNSKE